MPLTGESMDLDPPEVSHDSLLGDVFRYGLSALCRGSEPRR